jgi:twitching motility protein PilT
MGMFDEDLDAEQGAFGVTEELQTFWGKTKEVLVKPIGAPFPNPKLNDNAPARQNYGEKIEVRDVVQRELGLDDLLDKLLAAGSSDLHLTSTAPPMMRKNGDITPMEGFGPLTSSQIQRMVFEIMSPEQQKEFEQTKELDMAYSLPGKSRFRVNVMRQRGQVGSVIRVIPHDIKSLEQLGMPPILNELATLPRGLVLVTGPTGSGKSTTLAAIVDRANRTRHDHIITIEDPIEFVHENKNCIINQREVGADTRSFAEALKHALRQDPDIILLGEMRDPETISTAITAAETGHLVFGTLHTQSAAETMSRIIDSFPDGSKNQIRAQLAATIQGIVCQTLVKTLDGHGRIAAVEILRGEPSIRSLIRKGHEEQIRSALETNKAKGMQTLDGHLKDLVISNQVSVDEGASRSTNLEQFYSSLGGDEAVAKIRRTQEQLGGSPVGFKG